MIDDSVNLWLRSTTDRPSSPPSSKDDRAEWIVGDICEAIDCNGGLQFVVEAFGPLSADVSDLALTLEQLPQVARTIDAGETEYEISFFRDGVATTLFFEEEGEQVRLLAAPSRAARAPVARRHLRGVSGRLSAGSPPSALGDLRFVRRSPR